MHHKLFGGSTGTANRALTDPTEKEGKKRTRKEKRRGRREQSEDRGKRIKERKRENEAGKSGEK